MARSFRMNLTLEDDLHNALALEAERSRRSLADVIRDRLRSSVFGNNAESPARGIGELAQKLLSEGLTNEQVLAEVRQQFPDAATTMASVSWYRSDMRRRGLKVLTQVEAKRGQA